MATKTIIYCDVCEAETDDASEGRWFEFMAEGMGKISADIVVKTYILNEGIKADLCQSCTIDILQKFIDLHKEDSTCTKK